MMTDKEYVVVTTITSHRIRYVMHRDDLQKLNPDLPVDSIEWANDTVSSGECDEFSQEYMGEYIVDSVEMNEDDMLNLFDRDNEYLSEWTKDKKIELVRKSIVTVQGEQVTKESSVFVKDSLVLQKMVESTWD